MILSCVLFLYARFMDVGGWELLNVWLSDAKKAQDTPLLLELLQVSFNNRERERERERERGRERERERERERVCVFTFISYSFIYSVVLYILQQ